MNDDLEQGLNTLFLFLIPKSVCQGPKDRVTVIKITLWKPRYKLRIPFNRHLL